MSRPVRCAAVGLALILAGCGTEVLDPTVNAYTWQPEGINEQNIAAQVANPADIAAPRGNPWTNGAENVAAINRWRAAAGQSPAAAGSPPAPNAGSGSSGSGLDTGLLSSAGPPPSGSGAGPAEP